MQNFSSFWLFAVVISDLMYTDLFKQLICTCENLNRNRLSGKKNKKILMSNVLGNETLTTVVEMVMALDEFSKLQLIVNVHQPHNNATTIESMWQLAVFFVSYAFVVVAVELSRQNHFPIYPRFSRKNNYFFLLLASQLQL